MPVLIVVSSLFDDLLLLHEMQVKITKPLINNIKFVFFIIAIFFLEAISKVKIFHTKCTKDTKLTTNSPKSHLCFFVLVVSLCENIF